MTTAELPRGGAEPERLTGSALISAHIDYFTFTRTGQLQPNAPEILNGVQGAAARIKNGLGPFINHLPDAATAFENHFWERWSRSGEALDNGAVATLNRKNAPKILISPIMACAFSLERISDLSFMVETAEAFSLDRLFVISAVNTGKAKLLARQLGSERNFGLNEKAINAMTKQALGSLSVKRHWWSPGRSA